MPQDFDQISKDAERIYRPKLREILENTHTDEFVAIEPESREYFLGRTLSEAIGVARKAHPSRLVHAMRVGHKAALHFGAGIR